MHHSLKMKPKLSVDTAKPNTSHRSNPSSPNKANLTNQICMFTNTNQPQLWNQSSMSLVALALFQTRQNSPKHSIPNMIRFRSIEVDSLAQGQFLTLELRRQIQTQKGIRFPRSHRPQHFVKGLGHLGPSPASYHGSQVQDSTAISFYNPQKYQFSDTIMKHTIKGRSFTTFEKQHKSYIDHSKHKVYQPQNIEGQPGPGKYNCNFTNKNKKSSYTMRAVLKRFNDKVNVTPGPGAYGEVYEERGHSPNQKGTFQQSKRSYLTKFERNPSPQQYNIKRFCQRSNE